MPDPLEQRIRAALSETLQRDTLRQMGITDDRCFRDLHRWGLENFTRHLRPLYAEQQAELERLRKALESAVKVIRVWSEMGSRAGLPQEALDRAWEIYYKQSPEMQPIRAALEKR